MASVATRVMVTEDFPPKVGGVSRWAYEVARALSRKGEKVVVFARRKVLGAFFIYRHEEFDLRPMWGRGWTTFRPLYLVYYTLKIALGYRHPVIYALNWKLALAPALIKKLLPVKLVTVAHGRELLLGRSWPRTALMAFIFRNSDITVTVSRFPGLKVEELGVPSEKVTVISNGVDTSRFRPGSPPKQLVRRFGLEGKKVILTLARLVERKGQDKVIEALPVVLSSVPEAVYLVAGEGYYRRKLEELASKLGVSEQVIFAGRVTEQEIVDFYNLSDLFVMPCRELPEGDVEGFGITFLEAGACGKVSIGGRSGGAFDAVEDGVTGFLVDPEDMDGIAHTIIRLLTEPELRSKLGENARRRAEKFFSWEKTAEALLMLDSVQRNNIYRFVEQESSCSDGECPVPAPPDDIFHTI